MAHIPGASRRADAAMAATAARAECSVAPGQARPCADKRHSAPHHRGEATTAPPRLELREQRDHHDPVTLAAVREDEDELEQRPFQIEADEDDRRREARRLRPMA